MANIFQEIKDNFKSLTWRMICWRIFWSFLPGYIFISGIIQAIHYYSSVPKLEWPIIFLFSGWILGFGFLTFTIIFSRTSNALTEQELNQKILEENTRKKSGREKIEEAILIILSILFCCISIGGVFSDLFYDSPDSEDAYSYFKEGFLITLGGFILFGLPRHFFLKKKGRLLCGEYFLSGLKGGAIYGAIAAIFLGILHHVFNYESLFVSQDSSAIISIGAIIRLIIFGSIGGSFCGPVFWSFVVARRLNWMTWTLTMLLSAEFWVGMFKIFLSHK